MQVQRSLAEVVLGIDVRISLDKHLSYFELGVHVLPDCVGPEGYFGVVE
jgi:hypothetical protein